MDRGLQLLYSCMVVPKALKIHQVSPILQQVLPGFAATVSIRVDRKNKPVWEPLQFWQHVLTSMMQELSNKAQQVGHGSRRFFSVVGHPMYAKLLGSWKLECTMCRKDASEFPVAWRKFHANAL